MSGPSSTSKDIFNGWAPASLLMLHNDRVRTSVRFNPREPHRQENTNWRVRVTMFGSDPINPVWEHHTDPFPWNRQFTLESTDIARDVGVSQLDHYLECLSYCLDATPTHEQIVAPAFAHYTSTDGSFEAHLPSSYIYGSRRAYKMKSRTRYQQFPCVEVGGPYDAHVCLINSNVRKGKYWVQLVTAQGERRLEYGPFSIRPKSVARWRSEDTAGIPLQQVGVIVKTNLIAPAFVGSFNREAGTMTGLDHTHPFFPEYTY
jgi:hypothetical protein